MTGTVSPPELGLVEDSDEDFAAFERVLAKEAPDATVKRWRTAEDLLADLGGEHPTAAWPRALVVDLNLPGIDGAELVRRLRANQSTRALPAFVLSGSGRQRDIDRCYDAGANAYLTKPGGSRELQALLRMLLTSIATFRTPSPVNAAEDLDVSDVVDQTTIDATRDAYERELVEQRDAERRARRRAEALQRLSTRLADASDTARVESDLLELLLAGTSERRATITPPDANSTQRDALFMPDPFGEGTIGLLPLTTDGGRIHGILRVEVPAALDDDEEALLHGAASLASQALARIERGGGSGGWAAGGAHDLPTARWWHDAAQSLLDDARAQGLTATLVVVDLDLDAVASTRGFVEADSLLLDVVDAWRDAGHDLLSPLGTELRAAVLPGMGVRAAQQIAGQVTDALADATGVRSAVAEWDGREPIDALLARARGALRQRS